jgi:hypothetical protein
MGALGRVNAPDAWMKSERAEMPFCEPRIVGRNSWWEAFWRRCLKASYRGQWQRMCSRVSVGSPHGQAYWPSRENPRLNSPVWLWPVRHCSVLPKSSRLAFRVRKWWVGFSEGGRRLAIAYRPVREVFRHSWFHSFVADIFTRRRAFVRVTPIGDSSARSVASLASLSALSFPGMPE